MIQYEIPTFVIKANLQKSSVTGKLFKDEVTPDVLADVCLRITGKKQFTYMYVDNDYEDEFVEKGYNKGRLAILHYRGVVSYISFSELMIKGRNSSVQSVPTAFNLFYSNPYRRKNLYYYFLNTQGNAETEYQLLIYRLMSTVGFVFLNARSTLASRIQAFISVDDIMLSRKTNAGRNRSNNSSYITRSEHGQIEIYGKTYGANKYETSLMCYAIAKLKDNNMNIALYEILEGNLKELPASSMEVIKEMGVFDIYPTDMTLEKRVFESNGRLRSPRYIFNLLEKLGNKRCVLCECEIPELVQGAHVWPVSEIRKDRFMNQEQRITCAIDGDNGLWLCENHHKLFDENFYLFDDYGRIMYRHGISHKDRDFITGITTVDCLPNYILTNTFIDYMQRRRRIYSN